MLRAGMRMPRWGGSGHRAAARKERIGVRPCMLRAVARRTFCPAKHPAQRRKECPQADSRQNVGARAPSSRTTPPGGRPGTTETMKEADNRSATASPRGGVESSVIGTRSTATQVNTIRRRTWTSLRANGEVIPLEQFRRNAPVPSHGGTGVMSGVVGGSRSGRGCVCADGRPVGAGRRKRLPAGVRAAIRAQANRGKTSAGKTGTTDRSRVTTGGAKGGRKVERQEP